MSTQLTSFGLLCRQHRLRLGKVMGDQAQAFACSVAFISAVERGRSAIPADYPAKFCDWLELSTPEADALLESAAKETKVVKFVPRDRERALLASKFADFLNNAPQHKLSSLLDALSMEEIDGKR